MLRLWPSLFSNILWVAFSADGLAIVQQTRGFNKRLFGQKHIKANTSESHTLESNASESNKWQSLINQLDGYLSDIKLKRNTQLNVLLGSDFVRYSLLAPQQIAMNNAEKTAYVHAVFTEIYGAAANDWHIKFHAAAPHQYTPAAAIDTQLFTSLQHLSDKYALKLNHVQPYLMAAFNALNRAIHKANGYLVLLENTKFVLIYLQQGECQQLQTVTFKQDWQTALKSALSRELVMNEQLNSADRNVYIYAPVQKNASFNAIDGWQVKRVELVNKTTLEAPFVMLESVL